MVLRRLVEKFLRRSPTPSLNTANATVIQSVVESSWCRGMNGEPLPGVRNPGIFVKPTFVSPSEEQALVACALDLKKFYGFTSSEAQDVLAVGGGDAHVASSSSISSSNSSSSAGSGRRYGGSGGVASGLTVQAERVTGRPELPTQVHAPWGYGDAFDIEKVPPPLQEVAARIRGDDVLGRPTQVSMTCFLSMTFVLNRLLIMCLHLSVHIAIVAAHDLVLSCFNARVPYLPRVAS